MFGVTAEISGQSSIELVTASSLMTTTNAEFGPSAGSGTSGTSLRVGDLASLIDVEQSSSSPLVPASTGSVLQPSVVGAPSISPDVVVPFGRLRDRSDSAQSSLLPRSGTILDPAAIQPNLTRAATILDPPEGGLRPTSPSLATFTRVGVRRGDQLLDDFGAVEILLARGR